MSNHQPAVNAIHGAVKTEDWLIVSYCVDGVEIEKFYHLRDVKWLLGTMEAQGMDIETAREALRMCGNNREPWAPFFHKNGVTYVGTTPHPDEERDEPIKGCCDD